MKIWCEVCDKEEAVVFCSADEAALCGDCDARVHHANKLAAKHTRFSLLHPPTFKQSPLCDICKETRGFLFCQEDRAILCRECDVSVHRANEYTMKHNRFLLTGVKLSGSSFPAASNPMTSSSSNNDMFRSCSMENPLSVEHGIDDKVSVSTSSISEYLMETLPGWRVDDFLEPFAAVNGFYH
ncbi:BZS1, SALT TOLERANCE HOMOLOG 7, B-box domain protein 20 [Hibiscus trionum]|uniref:BZS1, SALT TOLERANCE HOMOLOG 7, B-box domain protein 20 n=1 Tax=Hibiscus trionum TaxID=183268 RepID=A0A9W7JAS3_HIBTR|nr:BZS1, SALT TOLERANCE HOMOLOG 7, B-box domain protein 20 [Hibiscus trionum]